MEPQTTKLIERWSKAPHYDIMNVLPLRPTADTGRVNGTKATAEEMAGAAAIWDELYEKACAFYYAREGIQGPGGN